MNIFEALSQGKGRINEENMSAMLGFLLSPKQPHGLRDIFLRRFLEVVAKKCENVNHFDNVLNVENPLQADVFLEEPYKLGSKQRIVDIDIRIYSPSPTKPGSATKANEAHRIVVENKIRAAAADSGQFKEEFQGILQEIKEEDISVTMVLLTPPAENQKFSQEFESIDGVLLKGHRKAWLKWSGDGDDDITALVRGIIKSEAEAEILPLSEYLRHTLKAFVRHIEEGSAGTITTVADGYTISKVATVKISSGEYRIEQYANSTIRVVNLGTNKYEAALPVLTKINEEEKLGIGLTSPNGKPKNTRDLGIDVLGALSSRSEKNS